ncbi:MAG: LuxR family transcriptional regulator, maltose regulon positive regulatory protein [Candidatus Eremiobacteraeota bacterium]|nr:LuxR family transcriptional regulator, maltose regulon positive regulatory protein [Candidatus Eremiobacteraeota bacterium]
MTSLPGNHAPRDRPRAASRADAALIVRPRLLRRLDEATAFPVTVLAAPDGYGKTVLLQQYLSVGARPALVVEMPPRPGDLGAAVRTIASALRAAGRQLADVRLIAERSGRRELDPWRLARSVADLLAGFEDVVLLEDCHNGADVPEFETFLLELVDLCPRVTWILTTRDADAVPCATWIAYRRLDTVIRDDDLRLTQHEALDVARALGVEAPEDVRVLHELTAGWPTAFVLGVRAFTEPPDRDPLAQARALLDGFLAERVLGRLSPDESRLLFDSSAFEVVDLRVLGPLFEDREALDRLLRTIPLVHAEAPGVFRFAPLLREFLQRRGERGKLERRRRLLLEGARLQITASQTAAALDALVRAEARDELRDLLERHGFRLVESDAAAAVARALDTLKAGDAPPSPIAFALRAVLEAAAGRFPYADHLFSRSLATCTDEAQRVAITYRHALLLTKWNAPEAREPLVRIVATLERLLAAGIPDEPMALRVRAAVAVARALQGDAARASAEMREVLARVETTTGDDELRALAHHQASFVALVGGDVRRGRALSSIAVELAVRNRLYALAARAMSLRSAVTIQVEGRYDEGLRELEQMADYAAKAGDAFLVVEATFGRYDLLADKGAEEDLDVIEALVEQQRLAVETSTAALPYGRALRAAWRGDLDEAYRLLAGTGEEQPTPARRFRRWAEIALFAAFSGRRAEADEALACASAAVEDVKSERGEFVRRLARGSAVGAVAFAALGRPNAGRRFLERFAPPASRTGREGRALGNAARAACLAVELGDRGELLRGTAELRVMGLSGLAATIEGCPIGGSAGSVSPLQRLTKSELQVLRLIARGGTSEDVARQLGRSTHTVNVHVSAILRKLGCRTRKNAVALALESGLF